MKERKEDSIYYTTNIWYNLFMNYLYNGGR